MVLTTPSLAGGRTQCRHTMFRMRRTMNQMALRVRNRRTVAHAHGRKGFVVTPGHAVITHGGGAVLARGAFAVAPRVACTIQGRVEVGEVLRLLKAVVALGVDCVGIADTVGNANPR